MMICACGQPSEETCASCGRQNLLCDACGGGISADAVAVVLACPYCDSTLVHRELGGAPPYYPVNVSEGEAKQQLLRFCMNRYGIPGDFERRWQVGSVRLMYVPIYLYSVTARLSESLIEADSCTVPGVRRIWFRDAIASYRFAMRVRQVVDPDKLPGEVLAIEVSEDQAVREAQRFGNALLARDRKRFSGVSQADSAIEHVPEGQVFYPVYEVVYTYRWKTYRGVVDASNGTVCIAHHPMSLGSRAVVTLAAGLMGVVTFLCSVALFLPVFSGEILVIVASLGGSAVSLGAGLLASSRLFWAAIRSYRTGDDQEQHEHAIDIPDLRATFPVTDRLQLD